VVEAGRQAPPRPPTVGRRRAAHAGLAAGSDHPSGRHGAWTRLGTDDAALHGSWPSPPPDGALLRHCSCERLRAAYCGHPDGRRRLSVGNLPLSLSEAIGKQWTPHKPIRRGPTFGRTPSRLPQRGFPRVHEDAAEVARRRRRAPAATKSTTVRWGYGGATSAGAEHHADKWDAGLSSCAKDVGARLDRVEGELKSLAVAPLVRRLLAWSAWRRSSKGDCTGLSWGPPCGVGEKRVKQRQRSCFGGKRQWPGCW